MFHHEYNVYETLRKIDNLQFKLANEDEENQRSSLEEAESSSLMDRAEYAVLASCLARGAAELLIHLAIHEVVASKTLNSYEVIRSEDITTVSSKDGSDYSDEIVTIKLPSEFVQSGAVLDSVREWNIGTIETVAELTCLSRLWSQFLKAESKSVEEEVILNEWSRLADRVSQKCLSGIQLLDASGMLAVRDLRTGKRYLVKVVAAEESGIELGIVSDSEVPARSGPRSMSRKKRR